MKPKSIRLLKAMPDSAFYSEWLPLEKNQFCVLALLAVQGEFNGTLTDMCRHLLLTVQSKNRNALKASIEDLTAQGFLSCDLKGHTYHLTPVPKGTEIKAFRDLTQAIMRHEYSSESVAWEQVLKVYLWICNNQKPLVTDAEISADLNTSSSTILAAKNVLEREFNAIGRERITVKQEDGSFRCVGQKLVVNAWWNTA